MGSFGYGFAYAQDDTGGDGVLNRPMGSFGFGFAFAQDDKGGTESSIDRWGPSATLRMTRGGSVRITGKK
jgi:hypothetical protein